MLAKGTLRTKMWTAAALAALALAGLTAVDIYSVRQGIHALATVYEDQVKPVAAIQEMERDLKEVRFRMAGVLLDQMPAVGSSNQLKEAVSDLPKQWAIFQEKTGSNLVTPHAKELAAKIDKNMPLFLAFSEKLANAYSTSDKKALSSLLEDDWPTIQAGVVKPLEQLIPEQQNAVKESYEASRRSGKKLISVGLAMSIGSALILGVFGFLISGAILGPLRQTMNVLAAVAGGDLTQHLEVRTKDELGAMAASLNRVVEAMRTALEEIDRSAHHLASASQQLSATASQSASGAEIQKDQVHQVATAMQEMSSTVHEVSENCSRAAESARQAAQAAHDGGTTVEGSLDRMRSIAGSVRETAQKVQELGNRSDQIGKIVNVIEDIADQTNLLALNAAIEAARAGDQGRGFAVVADEVRKLAERTTQATKEIAEMIHGIQTDTRAAVQKMQSGTEQVEKGVEVTSRAGDSLKQITKQAEHVGEMVTHIATAAAEQSSATDQVNGNMDQINKLVSEAAAGAQQAAKACDQLSSLAVDLQRLVGRFQLGNDASPAPADRITVAHWALPSAASERIPQAVDH
ncbi:MAG: methyl-accepting chemotaxis protein [Terriglobales bacterium]